VFLISILATNFLMVSKVNYFSRLSTVEGMQTKDASKDAASKDATPSTAASSAPSATTPSTAPKNTDASTATPKPTPTKSKKTSGEKEGMNGKLAPAKFNDDDDDEGSATPFPGTKTETNAQMERAHDSLQNINNGAMKVQTEEVLKQQKVLMDNIKTMQPFLETAERFLDKFNMKGIDGLLGKIGMGSNNTAAPGPSATA